MKKSYQLPEATESPFKGKDRFMKDKQKRYVKLDSDTSGTMGYWDKTCVQMYTLEIQQDGTALTCILNRQEEKKGKTKKPHDRLFAVLVGVVVFAVLYLILRILAGLRPVISVTISVFVGLVVMIGMLVIYTLEYRGFYKLLDLYLKKTLRASPK